MKNVLSLVAMAAIFAAPNFASAREADLTNIFISYDECGDNAKFKVDDAKIGQKDTARNDNSTHGRDTVRIVGKNVDTRKCDYLVAERGGKSAAYTLSKNPSVDLPPSLLQGTGTLVVRIGDDRTMKQGGNAKLRLSIKLTNDGGNIKNNDVSDQVRREEQRSAPAPVRTIVIPSNGGEGW